MMKHIDSMKSLNPKAVAAVRDFLGAVPSLEVDSVDLEQRVGANLQIDGRVRFRHGGLCYGLLIEVKSNGAPRFARAAVYRLESCVAQLRRSSEANAGWRPIPMLVTPYLSPESRAICTDHKVAYLDLVGNAWLAFDTVYIERAVTQRPRSEARTLRSIFTPKAAAILRVLLRDPDRAWRVADLATQARASYGHVSPAGRPAANVARELSPPGRPVHHRIHPSPWKAA